MSRRKKRDPRGAESPPPEPGRPESPPVNRIARDIAILLAAFGIGVAVAELFGAANLGVAFGVGQVVFAVTLVVLLSRD